MRKSDKVFSYKLNYKIKRKEKHYTIQVFCMGEPFMTIIPALPTLREFTKTMAIAVVNGMEEQIVKSLDLIKSGWEENRKIS